VTKFLVPTLAAGAVAGLLIFHPFSPTPAPAAWSNVPERPAAGRPSGRTTRVSAAAGGTVVYVAGAVVHPGLYTVAAGARVDDAVRKAGGFKPNADLVAVDLAAHVDDGDEVAVPLVGEARPRARRTSSPRAHRARHGRGSRRTTERDTVPSSATADVDAVGSVDLNTADAGRLAALPGVGASIAQRIVDYREINGSFASTDDLLDVAGITPARFAALEAYVVVR
jgi:competence protein ComEA